MHLLEKLRADHAEITAIRRDIHAHPELAFEEHRTAAIVAERLRSSGHRNPHAGSARPASSACCGPAPVAAGHRPAGRHGRAADPGEERLQPPLPPRRADARLRPRRPHGHAAGSGGASGRNPDFDGTVYFLFQPAEEGRGRRAGDDRRRPLRAFSHGSGVRPAQLAGPAPRADRRASRPGHGLRRPFRHRDPGHGAHAAMPHQGIDPVLAGAALVQALQSVVSRNRRPPGRGRAVGHPVPCRRRLQRDPRRGPHQIGTVRAFRPEVRAQVEDTMQRVCAGHGRGLRCQRELRLPPRLPPDHQHRCRGRVLRPGGGRGVRRGQGESIDPKPSMGAEDFAYFLQEKPGCYIWLGNGPGEGGCTLHNPHYDFNDEAIPFGVAYWVRLVQRWLAVAASCARPAGLSNRVASAAKEDLLIGGDQASGRNSSAIACGVRVNASCHDPMKQPMRLFCLPASLPLIASMSPFRMLRRDLRAGELGLLLVALVIAVTSLTSVGFFTDRVAQALTREANQLARRRPGAGGRSRPRPGLSHRSQTGAACAPWCPPPSPAWPACRRGAAGWRQGGRRRPPAARHDPHRAGLNQPDAPATGIPAPGELWLDERLASALGAQVLATWSGWAPRVCAWRRCCPSNPTGAPTSSACCRGW
jgi:metal-dependent amidase/aminoacylase/carboxypeptidase family protein